MKPSPLPLGSPPSGTSFPSISLFKPDNRSASRSELLRPLNSMSNTGVNLQPGFLLLGLKPDNPAEAEWGSGRGVVECLHPSDSFPPQLVDVGKLFLCSLPPAMCFGHRLTFAQTQK